MFSLFARAVKAIAGGEGDRAGILLYNIRVFRFAALGARRVFSIYTEISRKVHGRLRRPHLRALGRVAALAVLILCWPAPGGDGAAGAGSAATTPSIWPAKGAVTSGFGCRNSPFGGGTELHQGIDLAVDSGTPVVATADGEVVQSGFAGDFGNLVAVDHGNGLATFYGHNARLAVSVGQKVLKGQVIAYAGNTGRSTGPHLHYEIRKDGAAVDPWRYLVAY
jgi:murein DD-endopeptidase MepM/ murein hydrolase activator NlpD